MALGLAEAKCSGWGGGWHAEPHGTCMELIAFLLPDKGKIFEGCVAWDIIYAHACEDVYISPALCLGTELSAEI